MIQFKSLRFAANLAIILALSVMMLGAYTRLTNAGLGCPDWPGCYGKMVLPHSLPQLVKAQSQFPDSPIEASKAWTEMGHRYAAGLLALFTLFIFITTFFKHSTSPYPRAIPLFLLFLVVFQALLGMWTVTLKLLPVVVMSHLLGGVLIFASLCYFRWQLSDVHGSNLPNWRLWISVGMVILLVQIALGGWVSSNYAGVACIGFPQCNGQWLSALSFSEGFNLFTPVGANYQGGLLENEVRVTIQFIHRIGAVLTAVYILVLSALLLKHIKAKPLRIMAVLAITLVLIQFSLGVINVTYLLPLWAAVAHNGVAALLLATMVSMRYLTKGRRLNAT